MKKTILLLIIMLLAFSACKMEGKWIFLLQVPGMTSFLQFSDRCNSMKNLFTGYLPKGGTRDPLEMYIAFRGKEPGVDALLINRGLK